MTNTDTTLKPCPWCLANEDDGCLRVESYGIGGLTLYKVACSCGATREGFTNEAQAVAAWNQRKGADQ